MRVGTVDTVADPNRRAHMRARQDSASSCRLFAFYVKAAFWGGLCAIISSRASASRFSSEPSHCNTYNHDRRHERRKIQVDGSEDDNRDDYDFDSVPWQTSLSNFEIIDEAARYEDMPPSVFSPTGRLHPVEAAVRASKAATPLSNLVLAMRCRDGLVVISTLPISPHVDARIASVASNANTTTTTTTTTSTIDDTDNETSASTADETEKTSTSYDTSLYPSLFLFDETCSSTMTGSIFDIHPCIVAATGGNAVDNRIMRSKLLALGLDAMELQGIIEEDVRAERVAKDLADQLQVVTQDIAAAQKQNLGRLLASSALILGNGKIWRIDPTGQFWDCHATAIGTNADKVEEEFYRRLLEECEYQQQDNIPELLDSMSQTEALSLVKDFIETRLTKQHNSRSQQSIMSTKSSQSTIASQETKSEKPAAPDLSSQYYWQALILDYSSFTRRGTPRRVLKRGLIGVQE